VFLGLGRYEEALDAYTEAIRMDPEDGAAHNNRGIALVALGRYEKALDAQTEAIRLGPRRINRYVVFGETLVALGRYEEALDVYTKAIRLDPNEEAGYSGRGITLLCQYRNDDAITCFRSAIDLKPSDALEARVILAVLLLRLDPDQSRELSKAALTGPGGGLSYFRRGELRALAYLMLGESNEAVMELQSATVWRTGADLFQGPLYELLGKAHVPGLDRLLDIWTGIRQAAVEG
jgi:tetratricopeptide (TPR) repeat protein